MIEVTPEMLKQIPAGIKMTFNANGTFKFENEKAGITAITGKYTIKGKDLNCKPDGKEEVKTLEIVSLSSQVLELKDTIENDMILNMRFNKI